MRPAPAINSEKHGHVRRTKCKLNGKASTYCLHILKGFRHMPAHYTKLAPAHWRASTHYEPCIWAALLWNDSGFRVQRVKACAFRLDKVQLLESFFLLRLPRVMRLI